MTSSEVVAALLVLTFAVVITTHVALVYGLLRQKPRWHGLVALVVPPMAPYWGWQGARRRAIAWLVALLAYVVVRVLASR